AARGAAASRARRPRCKNPRANDSGPGEDPANGPQRDAPAGIALAVPVHRATKRPAAATVWVPGNLAHLVAYGASLRVASAPWAALPDTGRPDGGCERCPFPSEMTRT